MNWKEATMKKVNTADMYARMAARSHDPYAPVDYELAHRVTLPAPSSDGEAFILWDFAQGWCRKRMEENGGGEIWSRHRDRDTGTVMFTFSNLSTATMFALTFRGL
jgi:hypothetical protein